MYRRLRTGADQAGGSGARAGVDEQVEAQVEAQVEEASAVTGPSLELLHAALARRTGAPWALRLPAPVATAEQRARLARFMDAHPGPPAS